MASAAPGLDVVPRPHDPGREEARAGRGSKYKVFRFEAGFNLWHIDLTDDSSEVSAAA